MAITLYYWPLSSANRVWWALDELELSYEKVRLDRSKNEQKAPEFMKLNPNGLIPVLTDGGATLFESLAILIHLGEKYGVEKGLWPKVGSDAAAQALVWSVWGSVTFDPLITQFAMHGTEVHFALPKEQRVASVAEWAKSEFYKTAAILNNHLEGREYLVGDSFSLVDVANAALAGRAMRLGLDLSNYPNIGAWAKRCLSRPKFQAVIQAK